MPSSQTDLAVLAVLSIRPATGYAIRETITADLSGFWSESFGQIYPTLSRLKAAGLVETETGSRTGSALYRLSGDGRAHLLDLLTAPPAPAKPRNGLLLRVFFGDLLGPQACADLVRAARERAEQQLRDLAVARAEAEADPAATRYWLLTISAGEHAARAAIAWADEALAELSSMPG